MEILFHSCEKATIIQVSFEEDMHLHQEVGTPVCTVVTAKTGVKAF